MDFRREVALGGEQRFDLLWRGLVQLGHLFRRDIRPRTPAHDVEMSLQYLRKCRWRHDFYFVFGRVCGGCTREEGDQHRTQQYCEAPQIGTTEFTKGYDSPPPGMLCKRPSLRAAATASAAAEW